MATSILIRLGGLAAILGGVLFLASPALLLGTNSVLSGFVLALVGLVLVPVGMVGFHALQGRSYGRVGRGGFWSTVVGALVLAVGVADFFIFGDMLQDAAPVSLMVGALVLLVGFVLYGVATLQARILPRWCGVAFIVALPLVVVLDLVVGRASWSVLSGWRWASPCGDKGAWRQSAPRGCDERRYAPYRY